MSHKIEEKKNFSYTPGMTVKINPKHLVFKKYGINIQLATVLKVNKSYIEVEILSLDNPKNSSDRMVVFANKNQTNIIINPYYLTAGDIEEVFHYYISDYYPDDVPKKLEKELASLEGEPFLVPVHSFEPKTKPDIPTI